MQIVTKALTFIYNAYSFSRCCNKRRRLDSPFKTSYCENERYKFLRVEIPENNNAARTRGVKPVEAQTIRARIVSPKGKRQWEWTDSLIVVGGCTWKSETDAKQAINGGENRTRKIASTRDWLPSGKRSLLRSSLQRARCAFQVNCISIDPVFISICREFMCELSEKEHGGIDAERERELGARKGGESETKGESKEMREGGTIYSRRFSAPSR